MRFLSEKEKAPIILAGTHQGLFHIDDLDYNAFYLASQLTFNHLQKVGVGHA